MTVLKSEKLVVLPQRHETSFISLFNTNVAAVGQNNTNVQAMGIGILALQASGQSNNAAVIQHN